MRTFSDKGKLKWWINEKCQASRNTYGGRIIPIIPGGAGPAPQHNTHTVSFFHSFNHWIQSTLDIVPLCESSPQKRSGMACVPRDLTILPAHLTRSFAIVMSHTCLCFPSYS